MASPFISIIIPVYNNQQTLDGVLETLKRQTIGFRNLQPIFVDDCSTDGSAAILEGFARAHSNVTVLRTPKNTGFPGEPRNMGIEAAKAPYLMFLDADDSYDADACRALYEAIEAQGADVAAGYYRVNNVDNPKESLEKTPAYEAAKAGLYDFSEGFEAWCPISDSLWAKLYRRSIVVENDIRFDDYYAGDDGQFQVEYLCCCKSGVYTDTPVYEYAVHGTSFSHSASYKYLSTIAFLYPRLEEILARHGRSEYLRAYLAQFTPMSHFADRMVQELPVNLSDEQVLTMLERWQDCARISAQWGGELYSSHGRILSRDLLAGDLPAALFHFRELQRLWVQREEELQGIFSSTTWKLARGIGRLLGR